MGSVGALFEQVIGRRVTSDAAKDEIWKEAEDAFVNCIDDKKAPVGIWQGEFWGKLMISACGVCRYTADSALRGFLRDSVYRIMALQRPDGYIGTYKDKALVFRPDPEKGKQVMGWECDWNWNIWCQKYTLWGMLEAYALLEDDKILNSAARMASQLIDTLSKLEARVCETGTFFGVASASILKPMLMLYRYTGNQAYLDFSLSIAKQWADDETCCAKLVSKTLSGTPPHLWNLDLINAVPKSCDKEGKPVFDPRRARAEISGKVYETLSCFEGLLELYRVTGEAQYLHVSERFFSLLVEHEYNTLFSVGFNDLFLNAATVQNSITELCDVIHFIRLAAELYKLTGAPRYMDFIELAFYNPFLAGVTKDGAWGARGVRAAECHMYAMEQAGMHHNHCCVNNMPRGFVNVAGLIAAQDDKAVYVNLYGEAEVTLHPGEDACVSLQIGAGYLQYCKTDLCVKSRGAGEKTLNLRIPGWSKNTEVTVDGKRYQALPGTYFCTPLKEGATNIHIAFDSTPRLMEYWYRTDVYPMTPYLRQRYLGDRKSAEKLHEDAIIKEPKATLCIGPVLLSMCRGLGSTKEDIFDRPTVCGKGASVTAVPKPADGYRCAYDVTLLCGGTRETIPMCDFASAGNSIELEPYWYSVFI